jgi:formylglycine-generating enzyme
MLGGKARWTSTGPWLASETDSARHRRRRAGVLLSTALLLTPESGRGSARHGTTLQPVLDDGGHELAFARAAAMRSTEPDAESGEAPQPWELPEPASVAAQRENLVELLGRELRLSPAQRDRIGAILSRSAVLGQGNPLNTHHPMSRAECRARLAGHPARPADSACGLPHMVRLYDPHRQAATDAPLCIDQYEFPGTPCEYPVVHVTASEAVQLCDAVGKRICDAHEWEGACAGALRPAATEYAFGLTRAAMRAMHNRDREIVWAYGAAKNHLLCGTTSAKTPGCPGSGFGQCGSNTFPTGSFPECVSPLGVYDLHGNAAEHMNLPVVPEQLASAGGYGFTEMKGSWFIFASREAHPDDCRWRAPDWHGTRITATNSHANYHLGFRCCRDISTGAATAL